MKAEALGYAGCVDGGIHGSLGEIDVDSKRFVLENLLVPGPCGPGFVRSL
jgi:hypothetical protein